MQRPGFWTIFALVTALALVAIALGAAGEPEDPPLSGDWFIIGQKEFEGKTGYVDGNLMLLPQSKLEITDAVLTINDSIIVNADATLVIKNSTIKFNCSLSLMNSLTVFDGGVCTIIDEDEDRTTPNDASHITSTNDLPFNVTIFKMAIFNMRNSIVSKCGWPVDDLELEEGFVIRADHSTVDGCTIRDGHYGLIIDQAQQVTVENTTIEDCFTGVYMIGTREVTLRRTSIRNCTEFGIEMRGFTGSAQFDSVELSGNGRANLQALYVAGYSNEIINCDFGPGDPVGMYLEGVSDTVIRSSRVTGCDQGIQIKAGNLELDSVNITDCSMGLRLSEGAKVQLRDLQLADTMVDMETNTDTNITVAVDMTWKRVTANLTCDLVARQSTTVNIESSVLNFRNSTTGPTGIWSTRGGTMSITDSVVDSPENHSLLCQLLDGSRSVFLNTEFIHIGSSTEGVSRTGMWVGGTGSIEECTVSDSLVGLVIGRSQTNIINLTIRDCQTGILTDGDLGRGGASILGLQMSGCEVAIRAVNGGSVSVRNGWIQLVGEGFNITSATVYIKDSWVSAPGTGMQTATLRETATLDIVNSYTSREFDIGPNFNVVNIYWYLNLTLMYLSDGSPLSEATVTVKEATGGISHIDEPADVDGTLMELELRERLYNPDLVITTPHVVTVSKGGLSDSFEITVERSIDHLFYMDNYPPVLLVQAPDEGSLHFTSLITFEGEAWDAVVTATEGLASMRYSVDGGNWTPIDIPELTEWSFETVLEDGFHVVEIQARDNIGNINASTVTVEVDTKAPRLTVMSPENGTIVNFTDVTVIGIADPNVTVTVDGSVVELDEDGMFNRTLTLEQGENVIVIIATDSVGKETVVRRTVTVDTVQPVVEFDQEDLRTNQLKFTLSGTKKANATLYINGHLPEFFGSTTFEVEIDLPVEGMNDVDVWSEDLAGNNWTRTLLIERDTIPPTLVVGQLPEYTNKATVTVQGSVDDPDATVTVNGIEVVLSGTIFAHTVTLVEGENTITVEAVDDVGNTAEPVIEVVTKSTETPHLVITTPKFVETLEFTVDLEGETDANLPVSVRVVLGPYLKTYNVMAGADGSFNVSVDLPQVGNHSVTVTVTNAAGNQATDQLNFVRNRGDPVKPPDGDGTSWLEENWAYLILIAALIASASIWMITLSAGKRRRQELATQRATLPEPEDEPEDWEEEADKDEGAIEEEEAGDEEEAGEEMADEDEGVDEEMVDEEKVDEEEEADDEEKAREAQEEMGEDGSDEWEADEEDAAPEGSHEDDEERD